MPDSMIERVARALCPGWWSAEFDDDDEAREFRERSLRCAKNVVEALREPTEAMERSAQSFIKPYHDIDPDEWRMRTPKDMFRLGWRAMIDAILAEGQPAGAAPVTEGGHG